MGRRTIDGESPVVVSGDCGLGILSRGGSEKPPLNQPAPSGKAKHDPKTDSAEYREGRVKRTASSGVKQTLKPGAYKRSEPPVGGDGVPFA